MSLIRRLMHLACYLTVLSVCACANTPTARQLREMGDPDIAFLQEPDNLVILDADSSVSPADVAGCLLLANPVLCGAYEADASWYAREGLVDKDGQLVKYASEIKTLRFNDQTYAICDSIVGDIGWLPGKKPHRVQWSRDVAFYTRQSPASSVLYIQPIFALTSDGQDFYVYVIAGIQKMALGYPHDVYNFRQQYFIYKHHLALAKPGMSWQQQKDLAHQVATMRSDQAIQAWFADDGALLKVDFAGDMKQLDQGLRELFGAQEASVAK